VLPSATIVRAFLESPASLHASRKIAVEWSAPAVDGDLGYFRRVVQPAIAARARRVVGPVGLELA
jgi:hypothetical protein